MVTDYIRHLQRMNEPIGRISMPRPEHGGFDEDLEKAMAEGRARRARRLEEARKGAVPGEAALPRQTEAATVKRERTPPTLSYEQRSALSAVWRHACDWLQLHHLCTNARCRKAKGCRGEPVACFRAAAPLVPESARQFVRGMIEGQELGLDFDEAFEDAEEVRDGWAAWIAGLEAAGKAKPRQNGPK